MPQTDKVSVGSWALDNVDTESQTGIAKLFVTLPKGLNASNRSYACSVIKNFGRASNVGIRRGQLVIKLIVSDLPAAALQNDIRAQALKMLRKLDSEISLKPHQAKRDRPRRYLAGMRG